MTADTLTDPDVEDELDVEDEAWEAPAELAADDEASHVAVLDDRPVVVSAFAGIGGFDLGFDRAGFQTGVVIEWDAAASRVLAVRFPNAARFTDVRSVSGDAVRRAIGGRRVHVLTGGFPCQDLSVAGRRAGLAGERSGLYGELLRLAQELDPDWLVVENVPGLLSADADPEVNDGAGYGPGSAFALFLGDVTGYQPPVPDKGWRNSGVCHGPLGTAVWRVLDARHFGVAQRRRRVFVVVNTRDRSAPAAVLLEPEGMRRDPAARRPSWARAAASAVGAAVRGRAGGPVGGGAGGAGPEVASTLQTGSRGTRIDAEAAAGGHLVPVATNALDGDVARALIAGTADPHDYSQSTYVAVEDLASTVHPNQGRRVDSDATDTLIPGAQGFHEYPDGKFGLEDYAPPMMVDTQAKVLDNRPGVDTYNGEVTGEVAHTVQATNAAHGVPHVLDRPVGHVEASGGDDVAPTVTSKWAKGSGGPAGSETGNLIATGVDTYNQAETGDVTHTLRSDAGPEGVPAVTVIGEGVDLRNGTVTGEVAMSVQAGGMGDDRGLSPNSIPHVVEDQVPYMVSDNGNPDGDPRAAMRAEPTDTASTLTGRGADNGKHGVYVVGDGGTDVAHPVTASGTDGMGRGVPAVAYIVDKERGVPNDEGIRVEETDVAPPLLADGDPAERTDRGTRIVQDYPAVYRKSRRAATSEDDETWVEADHANTLNTFDGGDTRATEVILSVNTNQDPTDDEDQTGPLTTGNGQSTTGVATAHAAVRRLTPRECERLQGFPDDWTLVAGANGKPATDSPRYKQLGNAVCVNVSEWIACRIAAHVAGQLG